MVTTVYSKDWEVAYTKSIQSNTESYTNKDFSDFNTLLKELRYY